MFFNKLGLLGINARNLLYVRAYNPRKAIKMADDKIKTKRFLEARDIPVPRLYGVINNPEQLDKFDFNSLPSEFVLKPNTGFGGEGIIPIISKEEGLWAHSSGEMIEHEDLISHISDILDGRFAISGLRDKAFFEQLIVANDPLAKFSYKGLPDIRIIVYNLVPTMAMLRLPTEQSNGKGNLHLGAVGVGIDIATGEATYAIRGNSLIKGIKEEGDFKEIKIPFWDEMLLIASRVQLLSNLGYLAVDLTIDKNTGPVLLEMNARAGLNVQIANLSPLKNRLEKIKGIKVGSPAKGVSLAKDMFGKRHTPTGSSLKYKKSILGVKEDVDLILDYGARRVEVKIDPSKEKTAIDLDLARDFELITKEEYINRDKALLRLKFSLGDKKIVTGVELKDLSTHKYKMVIGKRDLGDFLIDPSKRHEREEGNKTSLPAPDKILKEKKEKEIEEKVMDFLGRINYAEVDRKVTDVDKKIKLLYHLRPLNLEEERIKFFKDFKTSPHFVYTDLAFDALELKDCLGRIKTGDDSLGRIFESKKEEILKKIDLLEHRDSYKFTEKSEALYGKPEKEFLDKAKEKLSTRPDKFENEEVFLTDEETKKRFEEVLDSYGLKDWKVKITPDIVADCVAGKRNAVFLKKGAVFVASRVESLIVHEIETHLLTAENGKRQPYKIFNRGLADYLETQEGLAIYNQQNQVKKQTEKAFWAASIVLAIQAGMEGSFVKVFELIKGMGFSNDRAFKVAVKVKRGLEDTSQFGAFTKDYIYFKGGLEIAEFVEKGGNLKDLYVGKISYKDVDLVKKILGLKKPKYLPKWI